MNDQEYDDLLRSMSIDSPSYDFGDIDLSGLEGLDLSGLSGLEGMDLSGFEGMNFDNIDLDSLGGSSLEALLGGAGADDFGSNFDLGSFEDIAAADFAGPDFGSTADLGSFEDIKTVDYLNDMFGTGGQNFGSSVDMDKSMGDFNTNLQDIMENRGGFTSQWQQAGTDRIMINDDGTGIGINENGDPYALSKNQVDQMVKNKQLNTFKSGYNTATGGTKIAPGGGSPVTLNNGKTGTLKPDGKVIDNDTGKEIGTDKDVKKDQVKTGGGGGGGGGGGSKDNGLGALLPLLLMMLMMNRDKGGGGSSGAVIPALTATQKQTPYSQQQRAPGYRPGQGGITYFDQTQYTPKMAAGGIARLLDGPGDGVSDSIPAVIDGGMAGGGQPAKVARGEYIFDARSVAALGNGSTDAGAERLDKMREDILRDDRKAKIGEDSKAYRHLMA